MKSDADKLFAKVWESDKYQFVLKPKKHRTGDRVVSVKTYNNTRKKWHGMLVYSYYTLNGPYKNMAYRVLCDDRKYRSFTYVNKERRR
jgi:hypothetical protein